MDVSEITGKREEQKVHSILPRGQLKLTLSFSLQSALVFCPEGDRLSASFFHVGEEEKRREAIGLFFFLLSARARHSVSLFLYAP